MASTANRWADYLQGLPPLARNEQSSAALFRLTTVSLFGPEVVIKRTSCPDDVAREKAEAEARAMQDSWTIFRSWGWETEVNPQGGYDVYVFFPPYMLHSLYDEINLRARTKDHFSEEKLWDLFGHLLNRIDIPSFDLKPNLFFYSSQEKTKGLHVCDLGFDGLLYNIEPSEFQLYKDTYSSLEQHQLATLSAKGLNERKDYVFLAGFMLLHLSLLSLPKLELQALQQSIDQNLLPVEEGFSEMWVQMLRVMLEADEALRPSCQKIVTSLLRSRKPEHSRLTFRDIEEFNSFFREPPRPTEKPPNFVDLLGFDFDLDSEW